MPIGQEWVPNEERFTFLGMPVYAAYKDDDADNRLECWFCATSDISSVYAVDSRDFPAPPNQERFNMKEWFGPGEDYELPAEIPEEFFRIAWAIWNLEFVPEAYTERFLVAKMQDMATEDHPRFDLRAEISKLLLHVQYDSTSGRCADPLDFDHEG